MNPRDQNYDYRIAGYFAMAMISAGIEPEKVKRIIAQAQIDMDFYTIDEAWQEAIEQLKGVRKWRG